MTILGFLLNVRRPGDWTGNQHHIVTMDGTTYHVSRAKNPLWRQYGLEGTDAPDAIEMRQRAANASTLYLGKMISGEGFDPSKEIADHFGNATATWPKVAGKAISHGHAMALDAWMRKVSTVSGRARRNVEVSA